MNRKPLMRNPLTRSTALFTALVTLNLGCTNGAILSGSASLGSSSSSSSSVGNGTSAPSGSTPAQAEAVTNKHGIFVGNPNPSNPAQTAAFEAAFDQHVLATGSKPLYMDVYTDFTQAWDQWPSNARWGAWVWTTTTRTKGMIPVIGIPMATNSDWNNQTQVFTDIANGVHDDVWVGIVEAWRDQGLKTQYLRFGYEFNGNFMPWYFGGDAATNALFVKAFQHMHDVVKAVPGANVYVVWNPCELGWNATSVAASYPGDDYVDVMSTDIYSNVYTQTLWDWTLNQNVSTAAWLSKPLNREHYWDYPSSNQWAPTKDIGWGLMQALAFAKTHNKPFSISETGVGGDGTTGPNDDGDFPKYLADRLTAPGGPEILFVNIWDINCSNAATLFSDNSKPLTLAAWAASLMRLNATP